MQTSPIAVYLHVPYCRLACPYCDFVKKPVTDGEPETFAAALSREIRAFEGPRAAGSIFFGGGTPSLLSATSLESIFDAIRDRFDLADPEISIEVNPDDVTDELLDAWVAAGINRVTLGVQSFNDEVLRYLGRCHDTAVAREACARVAGRFENWGMDLIFGARPSDAWKTSLDECLSLAPPHVSTYGLTYEHGTPFWKRRQEALDSDLSLELYREAMSSLADFDHYEVSNFARSGYQSKHNLVYWRNEEYAGFGPGAYSYVDGVRSRNAVSINRYLERPGEKSEALQLSDREIRVETLLQHFRTRSGLPRVAYEARFGQAVDSDFGGPISGLVERGLLEDAGDSLRPTRQGYELNDEIGLALVP